MVTNQLLTPVTDPQAVEQARSLLRGIVDVGSPDTLNLDWLRQNHWVAVPVQDNKPQLLGQAISAEGCEECFAISTEEPPWEPYVKCYRVRATKQGLVALFEPAMWGTGEAFALISNNRSFVILVGHDFSVIAGSKTFVERALGTDIAAANAEFDEGAQMLWESAKSESTKHIARLFLEAANRYKSLGDG